MRELLSKRNILLLAALTAATITVPAVSAQSATTPPAHKKATTTHPTSSSSAKSKHTSSKRRKTKKVKGQAAPTPERISEIQDALAKKGVLAGTPSGKWDDSTVDAVKQFQTSNGLTPSGKLDALTLQKLGLGSETAGLAPPTPPPNSINRLRNTSSEPATPEPSN
ncbi:MAG: peptidoglycan-binding domain-containing protein [Candidatus Acidiferrum sp.]